MKKEIKISGANKERIRKIMDSVFYPRKDNFMGLFEIFNLRQKSKQTIKKRAK